MKHLPFWLDHPYQPTTPLLGEVSADLVIIGGGLCGAAAALRLARADLRVIWLEAHTIAHGATGRNAGFILQGTAERYDRAVHLMGRERARSVHAFSLANHARMAEVIHEEGIDCAYRKAGSLQLASSPEEQAELVASAELLREDGFRAELLDAGQLPAPYREAGFETGVFLPEDGELDPAAFVRGAAARACAAGVHLHEHSPVLDIAETATGLRLRTPQGEVQAAMGLICTNAWTGRLLPWFSGMVDPVRGQMLATAPCPRIFELPVYADHGFDYWRQTPEGHVVLGGWRNLDPGSEVGFDDLLHPQIQDRMDQFLARFPGLGRVQVTHRWSGIMGFSKDGLPLVGQVPGSSSLLAAAGFTGHGFGFAWTAGEALAAAVLDEAHPALSLFGPGRLR